MAGTTVHTVHHYHRVGLFEQPDRMSDGYKQYQVKHLVRLLKYAALGSRRPARSDRRSGPRWQFVVRGAEGDRCRPHGQHREVASCQSGDSGDPPGVPQ
ncbi:MerR family transcriptional regulator [Arthrobacter sp. CAN_C5]|uniref:MerR family transcriptional regulator n=1 Tax=Arthrobacter sp. CAN_C5 TaxID=2760706 RepID=UPI0037BE8D6D